jgi:DNA-binding NarL/FixJ family response regulator
MNHGIITILTGQENLVLKLAAKGLTNKEIAQSLSITPRTVEFHLSKVFKKLNVTCRTAAAVAAQKIGLLNE